ncbi:hypothetical protein [Prosthecobacter sp.]|uniref:hypothetical protein n=1 Tax=Prosthecobacter sp. TaxID=1965333 RepID=UPI00378474F2
MKTLISLLAAASVFGLAAPAGAYLPPVPVPSLGVQPYPGARRIVSYLTNGTPVYAVYQIVGYDAMGYPIYQWVTQPTSTYVRPYYGGGYGYRSYHYRPSYVRPGYVLPSHGGHVGHSRGPVFHGGGHVSHGGGHASHGGGGHVSHGGGHHH